MLIVSGEEGKGWGFGMSAGDVGVVGYAKSSINQSFSFTTTN